MGLRYVNPAKPRLHGAALAAHRKKSGLRKRKRLFGAALAAHQKKVSRKRRNPRRLAKNWGRFGASNVSRAAPKKRRRKTPHKKRTTMSRKKLYGAAARAHAKKLRRGKGRKRRAGGAKKRKSSWRSRAARKAARTRAAHKAARRAAARKGARKRRHGGGRRARRRSRKVTMTLTSNPKRRRRRHRKNASHKTYRRRRRNPARHHARRRRHRRNPRPSSQRSMLRARRSIRNRYKTPLARATQRRYRMRSNPGLDDVMSLFKQVLPVAAALYGARAVSSKLLTVNIPGINSIPAQYQGVAVAGILCVGGHFLTRKGKLSKWNGAVMIGTGINLVDNLLMAFAPAKVKAMFGLADYVEMGMGDYIATGRPIDDDITLRGMSDYVEVGAEEELGLDEELGLQEELGAAGNGLSRAYLGGVAQSSMLKTIPSRAYLSPIPERSFTKQIPHSGSGYDNSDVLYGGVFNGGF